MRNPFEIKSAELMTPREVAQGFVKEHTEHSKLASYAHTIMWGSRGSGKSMHCKFLEPEAQAWDRDAPFGGDVQAFLRSPNSFLGVYINCRDGVLNREELRRLPTLKNIEEARLHPLFNRYLACAVVTRTVATVVKQLEWTKQLPVGERVPRWVTAAVGSDAPQNLAPLLGKLADCCQAWLSAMETLMDGLYNGTQVPESLPLPLAAPRLTQDVPEFCEWLQSVLSVTAPFFLIFDEANELSTLHQRCVNTLIALRSQKCICIKVASQRNSFVVGRTLDGSVDETHDFTTLDLDGLYTNNREAYYKRIEHIANDRLARAGIVRPIQEYLPENPREVEAMNVARTIAEKRYDEIPADEQPRDKANFVKKYAPAIMYQEVQSPKAGRTYAGFDNIVHLSSGIVRSFLDCCAKMHAKVLEEKPDNEPQEIPVSVQGDVIKEYSDEFIEAQIVQKLPGLEPDSPERRQREQLHRLLDGMGGLFRARLMDKESREPRIISVSLKDDPSPALAAVLDLAEREAFLHRKWYRSKRGNRNLKCYILNRRLCPHFNLDVTGFQGRVEVACEHLERALDEPETLMQTVFKQRDEDEQEDSKQLRLFDM